MKMRPSRWLGVLCAGVLMMHATGCFGSFKLTQKIWQFNKGISGNKFVQWLVFLVFVVVPVYEIGALVDALVVNSIEFWSGSNPVSSVEGEDPNTRIVKLSPTDTLKMTRDLESGVMRLELQREGQAPLVRYFEPLEDGMVARDEAGALLIRAQGQEDGAVKVTSATGTTMTVHARDAVDTARQLFLEGGAPALAQFATHQGQLSQGMASLNTCTP
ncbi:DUF3332 domain-containing protein [Corallococcus praedator]|uniref:DUF3332 domain-containing protein n=1 Tax=Corallococcus praedator TaxID=2316724 RepID=A0ABX9Q7N9_9BACT|nr:MULTISPECIES: DUF3332 domain-containing protein [Corallococcus]RKH29336.1 DUF3332 domain-containing protein [Corallococcus sp. CA031C]RKH92715.1 DUF3332 domain-containing protein [Corallococcus praedator]